MTEKAMDEGHDGLDWLDAKNPRPSVKKCREFLYRRCYSSHIRGRMLM
jgi:hypothetical protein